MKYRTTCTQCATIFRLETDQLEAARGWVQCGVCGAAFDARPALRMEDGSAVPEMDAPVATAAADPAPAETPPLDAPTDTSAPSETGEDGGEPASPAPNDAPPPVETPAGITQRETASDLTSIILIDPDIPVPDDFGPMPQIGGGARAGTRLIYPAADSAEPATPAFPPSEAARDPSGVGPEPEPVVHAVRSSAPQLQPIEWDEPELPRRGRRTWAWAGVSVLLLVLLSAQGVYFLRDTLVSHMPQTRPALERMCELMGCALSLPKNLALLQIVGSDLETENRGRLRLTLTLGNRAAHAQAWPVLVLTLTDQRSRPLARRSFAPSEYLGDSERIAAGVPPRSEQPLSLPLVVHDLKPMGFGLRLVY